MKLHLWAPGIAGFGGGILVFSQHLARELRALGYEVKAAGLVDRAGSWAGFDVVGSGFFPAWARPATFSAQCIVRCGMERPGAIVCTHVNFGPLALLARTLFGAPITLVAHGVDIHPELSKVRRRALRGADRLLAVSAWTRQRLLEVDGIKPERIFVLPNTFDERRFSIGRRPTELARRLGLRPSEKVLLTVARLDSREAYKGYDRVVQALPEILRQCGAVRFVVVGKGDDGARLQALARAGGVEANLTLTGFVTDDELPDYYRLADVFAMPSTGEGFGIVYLEAMACGTPVLAGNLDGSVDALDGGRLGELVDPMSVDDIAAGIVRLLGRQGPAEWFHRESLSAAVTSRFGRAVFRSRLQTIFG